MSHAKICGEIQQRLEAIHPDSADLLSPELESMRGHLEDCSSCRNAFQMRQQWDQQISAAMTKVELPQGFLQRLEKRLAFTSGSTAILPSSKSPESEFSLGAPNQPVSRKFAGSRRRFLVAAVILFGMGFLAWWQWPHRISLSSEELVAQVSSPQLELPIFQNTFEWQIPAGNVLALRSSWVRQETPHSLQISGKEIAVVLDLYIPSRSAGTVSGKLIITPLNHLWITDSENLPHEFSKAETRYVNGKTARVWLQDGLLYVCVIHQKQPRVLELLTPHSMPT